MHLEPEDRSDGDALLDYVVRISARARHMQLRVSPLAEVEVVVPQGSDRARVPKFVAENQGWLRRTLQRIRQQRGLALTVDADMPSQIVLPAVAENWQVCYRDAGPTRVDNEKWCLDIGGRQAEPCRQALQDWLTRHARKVLAPWLLDVADQTGLTCARVHVRAQRTRWGSCSARRHINLNRALLFLPRPVVRYLFVHELCHTVHMNHSRRFWQLVGRFEPDYLTLDARLSEGWRDIPRWALTY